MFSFKGQKKFICKKCKSDKDHKKSNCQKCKTNNDLIISDNSLASLKSGEAVIEGFIENAPLKIKRRLLELGIIPNTKITLAARSFLSKVLLLEINGYTLSIRKDIAAYVLVKKI